MGSGRVAVHDDGQHLLAQRIGAAVAIHQALLDLAAAGAGILVVSEDLDELLGLADRIAVLAGGRLSPPVPVAETGAEAIGLAVEALMANHYQTGAVIAVLALIRALIYLLAILVPVSLI